MIPFRFRSSLLAAGLAALLAPGAHAFQLEEATVATVHAAFKAGTLSCESLVQQYLARIAAYDKQGPALQAILTVNPDALKTAAELDRRYRQAKGPVGPLHCAPIVLKDNFNTADMPTSGGNLAMKDSRPRTDAFTVARMREAGALILAKSNLQ
ncbi:MAG TPA: amidase family protein, partial [Pseudorhodoferax sp.]|nr:amidase family protein [Pseudorhodoferax sp.]